MAQPEFKYALEKIGNSYAPMYGQLIDTIVTQFYDYKYLRPVDYGASIIITTTEPRYHTKEIALQICRLHQGRVKPEIIELTEMDLNL